MEKFLDVKLSDGRSFQADNLNETMGLKDIVKQAIINKQLEQLSKFDMSDLEKIYSEILTLTD